MISRIRSRFGTAGLIVAIFALVAALSGGAYAASGGLTSTQKKQVKKIAQTEAKKFATAGPQGAPGAPGAKGDAGAPGGPGGPGAPGKSIVASAASGTECTGGVGGTKFEVEGSGSPSHVCNGKEGKEGKEGSPWTAGGTLPEAKTETGTWGQATIPANNAREGANSFPISFTLPLTAAPTAVFVGPTEESKPGCPGRGGGTFPPTGEYNPTIPLADPGFLCVYAEAFEEAVFTNFRTAFFEEGEWFVTSGASQTGTLLQIKCESTFCISMGTWAVTGPEE